MAAVVYSAGAGRHQNSILSLRAGGRAVHDRIAEMLSRLSELDRRELDPLSEVLQDLRLSGVSYCRVELTASWGIAFPAQREARFHVVVEGSCWLRGGSQAPALLERGDAVLLPHGAGHELADTVDGATTPLAELPRDLMGDTTYRLRIGGTGARSLLVCCTVDFGEPSVQPLLELMPEALILRGEATDDPTLPALLATMADEVDAQRIGAATVMTRLADVVITRIMRAWVEAQPDATLGWLAAIRDPHIGRALAAIHRRPGEPWSVEALADVAYLSRATFSERFAAVVGVPPARYVAWWRMHLASTWLRHDQLTIAEMAVRLGYDSESAFSRAFKRVVGVPPSALRRPTAMILDSPAA